MKDGKRNPHAVALGKLGASKGGRARMDMLDADGRRKLGEKAAAKRWAGHVAARPASSRRKAGAGR